MNDKQILMDALTFHGHKCWASTAGVRIGLAALEALGADRSGAKSLHAIVEYGDHHGAMCFGDGIQYTTGCTFGKGNIDKDPKGKLAVTVVDKTNNKAVRVAYKPTLQKQIKESPFMQKRSAGIPPTQIPEEEQWQLVNLIWDAPQEQIMTVGPVVDHDGAGAGRDYPLRHMRRLRRAGGRAIPAGCRGPAVVHGLFRVRGVSSSSPGCST
jgi:formylmethanofuran dehydrogenase subunit E